MFDHLTKMRQYLDQSVTELLRNIAAFTPLGTMGGGQTVFKETV